MGFVQIVKATRSASSNAAAVGRGAKASPIVSSFGTGAGELGGEAVAGAPPQGEDDGVDVGDALGRRRPRGR